jgi:O-antigen/teichoic acid export membrane protein
MSDNSNLSGKTLIHAALRFMGVNRAIGYGVLTQGWSLISGPISILLIASRFSKVQQGFYYTMSSLLAMQIFFELGLVYVVSQFASHEFAHLQWGEKGRIQGEPVPLKRLTELLVKTAKWYFYISVALLVVLIPVGLIFFSGNDLVAIEFPWRLPWILAVLGTALNLMIVPFFSIIMGSGDVATVNRRYLFGALFGSLISWSVIYFHGGLFAAPAVAAGDVVVSWWFLLKHKPELIRHIWRNVNIRQGKSNQELLSWRREVWPMQWKMAISFFSGFFIYQLFTPVLFKFQGPAVAGQMGMTLSIFNALIAVSTTWLIASSPTFGKLIAKRDWSQLDSIFKKVLYQSVGVVTAGAFAAIVLLRLLQAYHPIGQRFLPAKEAFLLFITAIVVIFTSGFAIYLRAHKIEPLMFINVGLALLQGTATCLLGWYFSSFGIILGFFAISSCLALPLIYTVWTRYRRMHHLT